MGMIYIEGVQYPLLYNETIIIDDFISLSSEAYYLYSRFVTI